MTSESDSYLINRAITGDRSAAGLLAERHRPFVLKIAYHALGNADDAGDVAQEALVYAFLRLGELRDRERFVPWLRSVTLSLCSDYRRRRGTRRLGQPITVLNEAAEEANYAERLAIRSAVAHLSEAHRTTLLLHYIGGWAQEEVAALLDIPVNTVRSRLMAAKRHLRSDLDLFTPSRDLMTTKTLDLPNTHLALLASAFPGARVLSTQNDPEPWMPFGPRVRLALADGTERIVDFRADIDPTRAELLAALEQLGVLVPRLIHGPVLSEDGHYLTLCEVPAGENLLLWALGGTPHRIRLATERAFEAIDRLQGVTAALQAEPIAVRLARRTLAEEAAALTDHDRWQADPWLNQPESAIAEWRRDLWFQQATARVQATVADITDPLVFTDYLHFFPNFVRIQPGTEALDEPLGWPGDARLTLNPLAEIVSPFGHFGDPLLGLAMVWIYDCYPFVHTGFVEQFLWRRNISRRDFAPRLALRALQTMARELPASRPAEGGYWDALRGYAEQGLAWM